MGKELQSSKKMPTKTGFRAQGCSGFRIQGYISFTMVWDPMGAWVFFDKAA